MAADPQEPDPSRAPRVLFANISRGTVSTRMVTGIMDTLAHKMAVNSMFIESGPYLDAGRNKAIANALRITEGNVLVDLPHDLPLAWDWLLFVDSDIEFNHTHVGTLFAPVVHPTYDPYAYPVISGVYINPFDSGPVAGEPDPDGNGNFGPVAYESVIRDDLPGNLKGIPTPFLQRLSREALATRAPVNEEWNPKDTVPSPSPVTAVDACGAGFLAIHTSLIAKMIETYPEPMVFFDEPVVHGVHYGEDFGFCLRVREMGYPVLVNRACTPLHHKTTILI